MLKKFLQRFTLTEQKVIRRFREHGGVIGEGCSLYGPETIRLDLGRAYLIRIGAGCKITSGVSILAHDYSRSILRDRYGYTESVGGSAPVTIGDHCFLGMGATILMGTTIGNYCVVGAGSVVKGTFPDEVVIAGNPARVVCTLEEYYQKHKNGCLDEAVACVKQTYRNTGKLPTYRQMGKGFSWMYTPRTERTLPAKMWPEPLRQQLMNTKPRFGNFEEFLDYACEKAEIPRKEVQ